MDEAKNCQAFIDSKPLNYRHLFDIGGSISPPLPSPERFAQAGFGKWFGMPTILSLATEGGGEGF